MFLDRLRATGARTALCCAVASLWVAAAARAQSGPAGAASAAEMTPAERAQRDANTVFKWILIHSDKPRKAGASREEKHEERREDKPAAAARAKPAPRAADAPVVASPAARSAAGGAVPAALPGSASTSNASIAVPSVETALAPAAAIDTRAVRGDSAPAAATAETPNDTLTLVHRTDPQFPIGVLRDLRRGGVQVRFTVLPDGSVAEPAVVTSTHPRLNASALAAVAQWRFAPVHRPQAGTVELAFDLD